MHFVLFPVLGLLFRFVFLHAWNGVFRELFLQVAPNQSCPFPPLLLHNYAASIIAVLIEPGFTALQRIPCFPNSTASDRVSALTPPLLVP